MINVKKYLNTKNIVAIAIMACLGALLMLYDFPIFVAPGFYKLDLGDLPCLIGAFAMGPIPGLFIQILKILIKLILKPTSTAFVGEIAAFITSTSFCVSAAYIYDQKHNKKNAIKAIIIASIIMCLISCIANYYFIIPAYCNLFNMPLEAIISQGQKIFPIITNKFNFVLCCVAPFNLIKAIIIDVLTIILYKHISPLLKTNR